MNSIFYTLPTAGVHVIAVAAYAHLPTGSNNRLLGVGSCPPASSAMDISGPTWVRAYPATGGRIIIDVAVGISHPTLRPSPPSFLL